MSVKRRGGNEDANYYYRFTFNHEDYCEGGFRLKAEAEKAERVAIDLAEKKLRDPENYAGDMTMRKAGEWWLKEYSPKKRSGRSTDYCRMPIIMDYFGETPLKSVRPTDVDTFLGKLTELRNAHEKAAGGKRIFKLSDHTRNHYRALLHALYERLRHKKMYAGENPVEFTDKIEVPTARCRFIYPSEEKLLTPAIALEPDLLAYYRVGIETGMRFGEMHTLRVKHVDFTMKHIFIPDPKNRRSRYVPIDDAMLGLLGALTAGKDPEAFVLPHWSWQYVSNHLYAICRDLGIKGVTIHVWRHTFAYNHLSQGTDLYKVSKLMGHSSYDVTQKHYGHLAAKDMRDALDGVKPFLSCNRFATADQILTKTES